VATARSERGNGDAELESFEETPNPLEHATPDVELADAQLALGRPRLTPGAGGEEGEEGLDEEPFDEEELAAEATNGSARALPAQRRALPGNRLINFLEGSWRELQRVQWPDRRQVMQATGVVIGFVIVAGVFLGVADWVATRVMNLILG
jgi:preprotein translocase subunit SecE